MSDTTKPQTILIINAGSSSIKYGLYDVDTLEPIKREKLEIENSHGYEAAFANILSLIETENIIGIGHRVVHGGQNYSAPQSIDQSVYDELKELIPLAPLHQPHNLKPIELILARHPNMPQIACFDTAFHRTQPRLHEIYALPRELTDHGVVRYGFHGSSYEYIASVLPEHLGDAKAKGRIIIAHLGNGASMCALKDGKSVGTTMGFTPLDGLMMGTRTGTIDPGISLYLADQKNMSIDDISKLFMKESGLKGVSGESSDMRDLLASNSPEAQEAIELFCLIAARQAASLTVDLGGLDAIVFTAGIGANSPDIRDKICAHLSHLGNFEVLVIPTREEYMMAQHVKAAVTSGQQNNAPIASSGPR